MLRMLGVGAACGKKEAQLMLMMLGMGAACGKKDSQLMLMMLGVGAACGCGCGLWEKGGPADAHDAGRRRVL